MLNKSLTEQTCSDKMAGYWPRVLGCVYGPRLRFGPKTPEKKEIGHWPKKST